MAAFRHADVIEVRLWGRTVGAVALDKTTDHYAFQYDPSWLAAGEDIAPLHVQWHNRPQTFPGLSEHTWQRLPAFLADALPDEFGNAITTAWLARQGVSASAITPLDRLAYLGQRAMGALEFHPPAKTAKQDPPSVVQARDLVSAAQMAISGHFADDEQGLAALKQLLQVGTSAGGQRAKAIVSFNRDTREIRTAQGDLPPGFVSCLLKLDGVAPTAKDGQLEPGAPQGFGRIEFAYHLMARSAGLDMTRCDLIEENGRAHFITERFDRPSSGGKIHTQTLCAMAHMDYKVKGIHQYDQLFHVLGELGSTPQERTQAFIRMVFNVAARNCDDHTKNTAFMLRPGDQWRLSPAYDLTFAYAPTSHWVSCHLMGVNGHFDSNTDRIARADLLAVAQRHGVAHASSHIDAVVAAIEQWPIHAEQAGVPPDTTRFIQQQLRTDLGAPASVKRFRS